MKRYRVAVLGCGPRGDDHVHGFTMNPNRFEIVGLCDQNEERLRRVATRYNITATWTNGDQMLADTKPDVFCFATLPHIRLPLIEMGLRAGVKAIAYEKPMALTVKEARQIETLCASTGVKTIVAHAQMYGSHWQQAKSLLDEGEIGELHTIHVTSQAWLMQLGTHLLHYAHWMNGGHPAEWVIGQTHGKEHLADSHRSPDYVFGQVKYSNDVRCIIECGPLARSFMDKPWFWVDDSLTLYGSHGYIRVLVGNGWQAVTKSSGGRVLSGPGTFFPLWDTPPYLSQLADWLDDESKVHPGNGATTYHGFETAMGLCLSSLQRRTINLPLESLPEEPIFDQLVRELPEVPSIRKEGNPMIRFGGSGVPTDSQDPREVARAHKAFGYTAAYVSVFDPIQASETARLREIEQVFLEEDVLLAEVGAWCNLVAADPQDRQKNFEYVCGQLALAEELGARCCVDFIGTVLPDSHYGPHPDNLSQVGFDLCVETVRKVIDAVRPTRTHFCLEMMQWVLPDSPEVYLELVKAVDRPAFGVHLDPVNIVVSPRQYFDTGSLLRRCFELLGPYVVSCHAKDLVLREALALHFDEVRLGLGNMDYGTYLRELNKLPGEVPLMLEHLDTTEQYAEARDHVKTVARQEGVPLYEAKQ